MTLSQIGLDVAYFAVSVLGDVLRLLAGSLLAAAMVYSLVVVTIFMLRNE